MSNEECNLKLQRIEITQGIHDERITTNQSDIHDQGVLLDKMISMLSQIRWLVTGGMGFFIIQNIGLVEAIKQLIGL